MYECRARKSWDDSTARENNGEGELKPEMKADRTCARVKFVLKNITNRGRLTNRSGLFPTRTVAV